MKRIAAVVLGMFILLIGTVPAFAYGHYYGGQKSTGYAVCALQNCVLTGVHIHDGTCYNAHYYGDGHDYHMRNVGYGYQVNNGYNNNGYGHCCR